MKGVDKENNTAASKKGVLIKKKSNKQRSTGKE